MKDVVEGKGTGLVMALHGSPGTGKVSFIFPSPPRLQYAPKPLVPV